MSRIRVLIADDEPLAVEGIALMLEQDPDIEIVGRSSNGEQALEDIRRLEPDLVFLDVQMPRLGGLEALERIPEAHRPQVIFVTAFDGYAVQAFEYAALDYLLKPFRDSRFKAAVARAKERLGRADLTELHQRAEALVDCLRKIEHEQGAREGSETSLSAMSRHVFHTGGEHLVVEAAEILWVEAQGGSVKLVVTGGQAHQVRESLQSVEQRLDPARFVRIHRSFVVNAGRVRKVTSALYGDFTVLMSDGTKIPLSRTYRDKVKILLREG